MGRLDVATKAFRSRLLLEGAITAKPAALKETVPHHGLGKQEKNNCRDHFKYDASHTESGRLFSCGVCCIRVRCHHSCLFPESVIRHEIPMQNPLRVIA